ncbi:hypothetical protein Tco_0674487, partial [Tanacetum coccineum]
APYALLIIGKVDPMHLDLDVDPLGILRPATKLTHIVPLVSAYSSFARIGAGLGHCIAGTSEPQEAHAQIKDLENERAEQANGYIQLNFYV